MTTALLPLGSPLALVSFYFAGAPYLSKDFAATPSPQAFCIDDPGLPP
ncbi:MAG: hypothetical protein R3E60_02630 [Alphaproteobacteria bacterium]